MRSIRRFGPEYSATRAEDLKAITELAEETGESPFKIMAQLGYDIKVVAYECRYCGAPMGGVDPDDPEVDEVRLGTCHICGDEW